MPYHCANALAELSEALWVIGEYQSASECAAHAKHIASYHGFNELLHRLERPRRSVPLIEPLSAEQQLIVRGVESLEGEQLLVTAQ